MSRTHATEIFLVNPPPTEEQRKGPLRAVIDLLFFNSAPLGIASIAACLERAGRRVALLDAGVEGLTPAQTARRIIQARPAIVGIGSTTPFFANALDLAQRLRAEMPELFIVLGGPHATSCPEESLRLGPFNAAVVGEGEETMLELTEAVLGGGDLSRIRGVARLDKDQFVAAQPRPLIRDLDSLPFPARHLLPLEKYRPQPNDAPFLPKQATISSRGCPYRCTFCDHGTFGSSYRSLSAERVVDEMEELVYRYGVKDIAFVDSLFMISRKRVLDIVSAIERRRLKVHWTCTVRANTADRETMGRMREAGCWRVRIGIEAGNPEVLKTIRKEVRREEVEETVRAAAELGLHPKAFFMIGHPTETRERIMESIELALALPLTDITVQINTPLPGAPQWLDAERYGSLLSRDWTRYSFWEPIFVPHGMSAQELDELYRLFYRRFYFRPVTVMRHLRMVKSWRDLQRFARAAPILATMLPGRKNEQKEGDR